MLSEFADEFVGDRFVKRFTLCYQTIVSLSVLSVCPLRDIGVLWPNRWRIKMKLGMQVGLDPGHIVLDGDSAPPPPKGQSPSIIGPYLLWPNGWMDQHAT